MGPHSELFRLIAETGILALLAACWLLLAAGALGIRIVRRSENSRTAALSLAILAGLGTYVIHGLFRTYIDLEKVAVPFWAGLGVLAGMGRSLASRG